MFGYEFSFGLHGSSRFDGLAACLSMLFINANSLTGIIVIQTNGRLAD